MEHTGVQARQAGQSSMQLYGLRTVAVALVVASHCSFLNQGGLMVAIMFCLSGFLAVGPFSKTEPQYHSIMDFVRYYLKKIINIYPSYCLILIILKLLTDDYFYSWKELLRILTFVDGPVHFWYLQETMVMYLVTPLIIGIFQLLAKPIKGNNRFLLLTMLSAVLVFISRQYLADRVIFHGNVDRHWFVYIYITGMTFGYLFHYMQNNDRSQAVIKSRAGKLIINLLTIILFLLIFISSNQIFGIWYPQYSGYLIGWSRPFECGLCAGLFIFLISLDCNCLLSRLFRTSLFVSLVACNS